MKRNDRSLVGSPRLSRGAGMRRGCWPFLLNLACGENLRASRKEGEYVKEPGELAGSKKKLWK